MCMPPSRDRQGSAGISTPRKSRNFCHKISADKSSLLSCDALLLRIYLRYA
jgi:hypothetical protein